MLKLHATGFICALLICILNTTICDAKVKIIGHRGVSKEAPENTLSSFARGLSLGLDAMEFDIHLSKDGVPIILHDGLFGRTTNGGFLQKTTALTLKQIKELDVGFWFNDSFKGEQIPTLSEVLDLTQGQVRLMVEIKKDNSPPDVIAQATLDVLHTGNGPYIIGSFEPLIIKYVMEKAPEYPVIGILEDKKMISVFKIMSVKYLAIWYPLITPELVKELHESGIEVWVFTVDNPAFGKFLESIGVDGIITNDPRNMQKALQ